MSGENRSTGTMSMQTATVLAAMAALVSAGLAQPASAQAAPKVGAAETAAIFKAAGAVQRGGKWLLCAEQPDSTGASIDAYRDLNGDGRPEALLGEDGTFCYGFAGHGYQLLSKQANGSWKVMDSNSGFANFLKTKSKDGWPDIEVGGPGFCFPVLRWNGKAYALNRHEYEGKACKPGM